MAAPGSFGSKAYRVLIPAASLLGCLLFWQIASTQKLNLGFMAFTHVPPPADVAEAAWHLVNSSKLLPHVGSSLSRVFSGYFAAAVLGIALGLLIGRSRRVGEVLLPPLEVLRPIPAVAWIPLAILMFPSSEVSMIFITFTGARFPSCSTPFGVEAVTNA